MPLPIYRLRRLLAATAVLLTLMVIGMYVYARFSTRDIRPFVPGKLGYEISKTANGFQISKSNGKRTLFSVQASAVKEFKLNGRAELHNVKIILYGRDSSRYDQVSGDDFSYDPKTGDVAAKGEVQIDLVSNPAGVTGPDQSAPKELKNTIHLKTRDLVFNKNTGDAATEARVEFQTPQANGWADGVKYAGQSNVLTLASHIHVELSGANAADIEAESGVITNEPREIVLDRPHLDRNGTILRADRAVFHLGADNNLETIVATGDVISEFRSQPDKKKAISGEPATTEFRSRADRADITLAGERNLLRTAVLTGNVRAEQSGSQPLQGDAGRVVLDFAGQNQLRTVHALDGATLFQKSTNPTKPSGQTFELKAGGIDFAVANGNHIDHAETLDAGQITISASDETSAAETQAQKTVVTAGKFIASFGADHGRSYVTAMHGAPGARIVSSNAGQPDRISTSDSVHAVFLLQGGIQSVTQEGNVAYTDTAPVEKRTQAWATNARYTPADQMIVLTGSPRVVGAAISTTARTIRINRETGEAVADTDVKSTYSELKEQPDGALLASSSPIHVTAQKMTARNDPGIALYTGSVRLWQDANVIEAPSLEFDRNRRFVTALGTSGHPVQTILIQSEAAKPEKGASGGTNGTHGSIGKAGSSPVAITAQRLTYADSERKIHYEGGVQAKGADFSASAKTLDAYLVRRSETIAASTLTAPGQLDHMVAQGDVLIQQPNRRADGQKLVYTAADDKFVLTGGPPSIFDAEHGKITGVSLTFFRGDDRVLVEGEASTPVVTRTRVAP